MSILYDILAHKRIEVAVRQRRAPLAELRKAAEALAKNQQASFTAALKSAVDAHGSAVIAEIKQASPSEGVICEAMDAAKVASSYLAGGASALSVLTDQHFFLGRDADLKAAKAASKLPCLRKDFILEPYQIYEAKTLGADAILLIVAALSNAALHEFSQLAAALALDVLVEVHDAEEMEQAASLEPALIGINNRNLHKFKTSLSVSEELIALAPPDALVISESGINNRSDIDRLKACGIHAFLIGTSFMSLPDPGTALAALLPELKPA